MQEKQPIQLDGFLDYKFLSGLALSPNGKNAAFAVHTCDIDANSYCSHIWVKDLTCEKLFQLTSASNERSLLWLDDDTLLFAADREKAEKRPGESRTDFYRIRIDGGEAAHAFTVPLGVSSIKSLSGGDFILLGGYDPAAPDYASLTKEKQVEAEAACKDEADYTVLDELPFWQNGGGVVNKQRQRLYRFSPDSGELIPLTSALCAVEGFQLNSDRSRLLYTAEEYDDVCPLTSGLYEVDLADNSCRSLLDERKYTIALFCYLGEEIFFWGSEMKDYGINENYTVYRVANGTGEPVVRLELSSWNSVGTDCRYGGGKVFHPAEDSCYFLTTDRFCSRILRLLPNGEITPVSAPFGTVDCFDIQNGRCVLIGQRGQGLQEVYSLALDTAEETRLTSINADALKDKYVAAPQYLPFTDSDGVEIDGWVLLPYEYDPAKKYPAILDVHGGPKTVYGDIFYHEMQAWASAGYFVFFCNPRGSDGRGDAFADIRGKYGTIDYVDLMEFTDAVLARYPQIDPARVGVTGGSYGGFMTNWIIGHTDRFAAAASQRSISNWVSMSYTTDIGYYFGPDQTGGTAWNGLEKMWEQSPLKYADHCKTPTLFIHSDEDYRCWMAEGLQMFTALRIHGVPARLCLFHGENHELSRSGKPKHRLRRLREITDWMDCYLKQK